MAIRVVPLDASHAVNDFDCGEIDLNLFLHTIVRQHQRKFISKSYVLIDDDAPKFVMGFYTLALRRMVAKNSLPPDMASTCCFTR